MPDERRHVSADLRDYQVLDGSDSLDGGPGADPLDRGVAPPVRWSTALRTGSTAEDQRDGRPLDELLGEEEPEPEPVLGNPDPAEDDWDENATAEEITRLARDDDADPRAGRLVAPDDNSYVAPDPDLVAQDVGTDGGAASAEEAAVHVVTEDAEFGLDSGAE